MRALLCPGQGSQSPGMLIPWIANPESLALVEQMSQASGVDLVHYGTEAGADAIKDTAVAQPLIVAAALVSHSALGSPAVDVVAGHSVGELAALALAGVISAPDAVTLAAVRGRAMADAAAATPTSMSAVVGGVRGDVEAAIAASGAVLANVNSAAQVVAAGTIDQMAALAEAPPARARVIPLAVAGAFHTEHMAPAVETVRAAVNALDPRDPQCTLLSNRDGVAVTSGADALERIVTQITSPVRWDLCQAALQGAGALVELAPGGVLTGLAKRELRGIPAQAITSLEDLPAASALLKGSDS